MLERRLGVARALGLGFGPGGPREDVGRLVQVVCWGSCRLFSPGRGGVEVGVGVGVGCVGHGVCRGINRGGIAWGGERWRGRVLDEGCVGLYEVRGEESCGFAPSSWLGVVGCKIQIKLEDCELVRNSSSVVCRAYIRGRGLSVEAGQWRAEGGEQRGDVKNVIVKLTALDDVSNVQCLTMTVRPAGGAGTTHYVRSVQNVLVYLVLGVMAELMCECPEWSKYLGARGAPS